MVLVNSEDMAKVLNIALEEIEKLRRMITLLEIEIDKLKKQPNKGE